MKTFFQLRSFFLLMLFIVAAGIALQPRLSSASLIGDSSALFVFGDSLSDTGNLFAATGGLAPPAVTYNNGRFSNGPIWIDRIEASSGLRVTEVTQVTEPISTGVNFAFGGATSGTVNVLGGELPGLTQQVGIFQGLLGGGMVSPDADALYIVWAGANDYLGGGVVNPAVPVANLSTAIADLHGVGARRFLVPNLPDLGATPLGAASGNAAGLSALTDFHNAGLAVALDSLSGSLSGIDITEFDIHGLFADVLGDPLAFGFTNPSVPCLNAPITGFPTGACPDVFAFDAGGAVFWDPLHPTTAAHRIIAQRVTVPEPSVFALFGVGVIGLGFRRRRRFPALPISSPAARIGRLSARFLHAGAAFALLIYFAPCFAAVAAAVRLSGAGAFFQRREAITSDGRRVLLLRFRTAPQSGARRLQRALLGFLRRTRIDELPVLINVMRGDVTLRETSRDNEAGSGSMPSTNPGLSRMYDS